MKKISEKRKTHLAKKAKEGPAKNARTNTIKKAQKDPLWHARRTNRMNEIAERFYQGLEENFGFTFGIKNEPETATV